MVDYDCFKNLIYYYGNRLKEDGAERLTLFFYELNNKIDNGKYNVDKASQTKYVCVALRNEFYRLLREQNEYNNNYADLFDNSAFKCDDTDSKIYVSSAIKTLTHKQQTIIILRYFMGFTDDEIATKMHISRQAIYKVRKRALDKLKSAL